MQLRRRRTAATLALAALAGTFTPAPYALATPPPPDGGPPTTTPDDHGSAPVPGVWPRPQTQEATGPGNTVTVGDDVALVTGAHADPHAVEALRTLLRTTGARRIDEVPAGAQLPAGSHLVVHAGGQDAAAALRALGARPRADLPAGGYRLAVGRIEGRDTVALDGAGPDGLFHAVQTLRQLADERTRTVPGVRIRDWPATAVRGLTEGFYGTPWTHRQRLAHLDFMGRTKQNRYLYAPGNDPYRQARWREPYPAAQRAEFRALAARAARNHVTLAWAVAPGQAMCLSSEADVRALTRKVDAMWALGVRAFQLQFQDVSYSEWHCGRDADAFGSGPRAAARAQARVADAVARHLSVRHPDAPPLSLMPTEYFQDGATEYRAALSAALHDSVEVTWTGVGVVPRTITGRELAGARRAFGEQPLITADNYPVNDFAQDRIFLGPYTGREPAVAQGSAALLGNAMAQSTASRIPLFTVADFAWNPRGYRPRESWHAAIDDLAGGDARARAALAALAGNDASSVLGAAESAYLRPLLREFWHARTTADPRRVDAAARALGDAFRVMRDAPGDLAAGEAEGVGELAAEVRPWTERLARYGEAGGTAVRMLSAAAHGDGEGAWRAARALHAQRADWAEEENAREGGRVTVGEGVLGPFVERAREAYARWAGIDGEHTGSGPGARWRGARPLAGVTVLAAPGTRGTLEAHVPGKGWRRLTSLSPSGCTELTRRETPRAGGPVLPEGLRADALRVVLDQGAVRHVVPWFADTAVARFGRIPAGVDVEIGGGARRVTAELLSRRPGDVRGEVTVRAPRGVEVRAPRAVTVPRGTAVGVPLDVTAPRGTRAGTYEMSVTFAGGTRTVSVRAFPRTGGPDLARGARATSSGDETADFPASAANDGDATTRWSSPADDDAWWQVELAEPVRLGQVVLRWQDAYAAGYRIRTSADGRTWRTAAVVRDGAGGRESVRMDAPGTRFVRVSGERRATRFGYSLWSVEAYAVAED
ncbi:beta-N-acetylglucosaminidase domain-containing protein [Streptomyces sp. NPDC127108]|uniref:beta-N-acetylglucosaminidase domain-containing protein n=1 Tax=Streptomyces sp. NPDC127108 TaxID=3345361 RepID=UPI0036448921